MQADDFAWLPVCTSNGRPLPPRLGILKSLGLPANQYHLPVPFLVIQEIRHHQWESIR